MARATYTAALSVALLLAFVLAALGIITLGVLSLREVLAVLA